MISEKAFTFHGLLKSQELSWEARLNLAQKVLVDPGPLPSIQIHMAFDGLCTLMLDISKCVATDDDIAQMWHTLCKFFADVVRSKDFVGKPLFSKSLLSCLHFAASASSGKTPTYLLPMIECACELLNAEEMPLLGSKLSQLSDAIEQSLTIWLNCLSRGECLNELEILLTTLVQRYLALRTFWPVKKQRFFYVCNHLIPLMAKSCLINVNSPVGEQILKLIAELIFDVAYANDYDAYLCARKEVNSKKRARIAKRTGHYAWMLFDKLETFCSTDSEQQIGATRLYAKLFRHFLLKFAGGGSMTNRCLLLFSLYGYRLAEGLNRVELSCHLLCCLNEFKIYNTYEDTDDWAEWFFSIRDELLNASVRSAEFYIAMEQFLQIHPVVVSLKVKDILIATCRDASDEEQLPEKVSFLVSLISYYGKTSQLEVLFQTYAEVLLDFVGNVDVYPEEYRAFQVSAVDLKQIQMSTIINTTVSKCLLLADREGERYGCRCLQLLTLFDVISASCQSSSLEDMFKFSDIKSLLDLLSKNADRSDDWWMCALTMAKTLVCQCVTSMAWLSVSAEDLNNVDNYLSSLTKINRSDSFLSVLILVYTRIANRTMPEKVARDVINFLVKEKKGPCPQKEGFGKNYPDMLTCQLLFEWSSSMLGVASEKYRQKFADVIVQLAFAKCDNRFESILSDAALWEDTVNVRCLVKAYIGVIAEQLKTQFRVDVDGAILLSNDDAYLSLYDHLKRNGHPTLRKSTNLEPLRRLVNHLLTIPVETTDLKNLRTLVALLVIAFKVASDAWRTDKSSRNVPTDFVVVTGRLTGSLLPLGFVEKRTDTNEGHFLSELVLREGFQNLECALLRALPDAHCTSLQQTVIAFCDFFFEQCNGVSEEDSALAYMETIAKEKAIVAVGFLPVADHLLRTACKAMMAKKFERQLCQQTVNMMTSVATELWRQWERGKVQFPPLVLVKTLTEFSSLLEQNSQSVTALLSQVDNNVERLCSTLSDCNFENFNNMLELLVVTQRDSKSGDLLRKHILLSLSNGPRDFCNSLPVAELLQTAKSFGEKIIRPLWPNLTEENVKMLFANQGDFPSAWLLFLVLSTLTADCSSAMKTNRFSQRCRSILFSVAHCVQFCPKDNGNSILLFALACELFKFWLSEKRVMRRGVDQLVDACHTLLASLPLNSLYKAPGFDVLFHEELSLASLIMNVHSLEVISRIPSFVETLRLLQNALHRYCKFLRVEKEAHFVCTQIAYQMRRLLIKVAQYQKDFARVAAYVVADFIHFSCAEPLCQLCMQEVLPGYLELHRCFDIPSISMLSTNLTGAKLELYATLFVGGKEKFLKR
ncbi:ATP-binding cassette transporter abc4 Short=ABC t ransporter abc4 [Trichuris trichiura]|uniref:ATP-binding cassette transporter abc4 Short=ABC t ransporter abc4 n=1 Tax=Trichuris trichiura TaxID=36087 RepID=A0A077YXQ4_TRITR|nr:ATP-binding cassette transporter abc4 Short=ABC t ransporter abc4 [Trichuris trichiura]